MGRMGTEIESGLMALYLAADATFCTGIDLLLSGGAELNYGFKSQVQSTWGPQQQMIHWAFCMSIQQLRLITFYNISSSSTLFFFLLWLTQVSFNTIKTHFIHAYLQLHCWRFVTQLFSFGILTNCVTRPSPLPTEQPISVDLFDL